MKLIIVLVASLAYVAAQYGHGGHGHEYVESVQSNQQEVEVVHGHGHDGGDGGNDGGHGGNDGGNGGRNGGGYGGNDGGNGGGHGGGNDGGNGGGNGGGHGGHHATSYVQVDHHDKHPQEVHFKAHPEYHYGFKVNDDKHHVYTNKHEERDGYKVKGSYSLVQPDGKTRIVDYTSDKKQGFVAKVTYKHHH